MKNLKEYPKLIESSEYKSFAVSAEIVNFGAKKKRKYDDAMTYYEQEQAIRATQYRLGEAKGEAKGRVEGAAQKAIAIAKALISKGIDIEIICSATGLSQEQIQSL